MAASLASVADVAVALQRELTGVEEVAADQALAFASARLRARVPRIDERIADGTLDPVLVASVVVDALVRRMVAAAVPAGITQQTAGAVSYSFSNAARTVTFTDDELRWLSPRSTRTQPRSVPFGWPNHC